MMKLFSSKVTRLTVVGPLALVYIALHRAWPPYGFALLFYGPVWFLSNDISEI